MNFLQKKSFLFYSFNEYIKVRNTYYTLFINVNLKKNNEGRKDTKASFFHHEQMSFFSRTEELLQRYVHISTLICTPVFFLFHNFFFFSCFIFPSLFSFYFVKRLYFSLGFIFRCAFTIKMSLLIIFSYSTLYRY